jgi:cyclophilin family peptidyl-prolyl cis-trans isomerase
LARSLTLLATALALALTACGGGDDDDKAAPKQPAGTQPAAPKCKEVAAPQPKPDGGAKAPSKLLDKSATYDVVIGTSCGDFTIRLDQTSSPKTAASFASLAESGFLDGTAFHRIVPGFVIQGGDPTGTGGGGPGYSTRDKVPRSATYTKGVVAMAKTQAEPPGTAGSQFFVVTAGDAGLPPDYALLGRVVKGQEVVDAIGQLGDPASGGAGVPLQAVVIEKATVQRR